jgi:hypothetical protein
LLSHYIGEGRCRCGRTDTPLRIPGRPVGVLLSLRELVETGRGIPSPEDLKITTGTRMRTSSFPKLRKDKGMCQEAKQRRCVQHCSSVPPELLRSVVRRQYDSRPLQRLAGQWSPGKTLTPET